ncbi:MAG: hypothetical protein JST00_05190 [Deltaproteobacteria bacterium]|nr:hypothetical protein [Deltaproteobacteria bacterium]
MRSNLLTGALVAIVACDQGGAAAPSAPSPRVAPERDFASGSRLRARYHRIDDLVDVLASFHDTVLDADCAFVDEQGAHPGPGASATCVPTNVARHREGRGPFIDANCTRLAAFPPASGEATIALVEPRDACTTAPLARAAAPVELRRVYLRDDTGTCVQSSARAALQSLGDVLPPSTFARAVEVAEHRDGRIDARVLLGDDGSRLVVGGFDRRRNEAVRVGDLGEGFARWLPVRIAFIGSGEPVYADASCTAPAATKIGRTATCPLTAAFLLEGSCGAGRVFELGPPVPSPFAKREAACAPATLPDALAFSVGAEIAASTFAPAAEVDIGSARLRRRGVRADGAIVAWGAVIDATIGGPCVVLPARDGELRCLPETAETSGLFADAACTEPAFAHPLSGCEQGPFPRYVRSTETPPRTFAVGRDLRAVFTLKAGACAPFVPAVESRLFAAAEVDPATFLRATEERDPAPR